MHQQSLSRRRSSSPCKGLRERLRSSISMHHHLQHPECDYLAHTNEDDSDCDNDHHQDKNSPKNDQDKYFSGSSLAKVYSYGSPDGSFEEGVPSILIDTSHIDDNITSNNIMNKTTITNTTNNKQEWQRRYTLTLYSITTILLFADQNLLAPNLSAAAEEFGFDDEERDTKLGGHIALAFFVLGAPASFAVGCLADAESISRSTLFGWTLLIGEGACFVTYFTTTYTGLYVTRALTGFSVGGALPLLSSVLGDWYPPEERSKVMATVGIGTGIGIAFGQGLSGFIGPIFGWRMPFLVVSVPALVISLLVMFTVVDPERGQAEKQSCNINDNQQQHMLHEYQDESLFSMDSTHNNIHGIGHDNDASSSSTMSQTKRNRGLDDTISTCGSSTGVHSSDIPKQNGSTTGSDISTSTNSSNNGNISTTSGDDDSSSTSHSSSENIELALISQDRMTNRPKQSLHIEASTNRNASQRNSLELQDGINHSNTNDIDLEETTTSPRFSFHQHLQTTKDLLHSKTILLILIQGAPGCVPWGIVNTFLNDYLSENCGLSIQAATGVILVFGLGNFVGMVTGGLGGDYLYKMDARFPNLLSGSMAILGCIPLWILINTTKVEEGQEMSSWVGVRVSVISFLAGLGSGVTGPIVKATLQNVTLPNARGQAFALLNTFDDFGRGLGPLFVAMLISGLGGRRVAFNVGIAGWVLCGIFNICIYFTVKKDEETTQHEFLDRYSTIEQQPENGI